MASIENIKASDGSGNANVATVQNTRSPGSSTIIVDTVLGINVVGFEGSMGTPHTFTDPITSETITVISEATCVDFAGHVDDSNLEIDTIAPGYTDLGSEVGDIIIIRPTTQYADNIASVLETAHNNDGTLKSATQIALMEILYPVGTIYTNIAVNTNPATLFGFGTWAAISDRVIVGRNATSGTFNVAAGATGGAETHTLQTTEIPGHTHTQKGAAGGGASTTATYATNNQASADQIQTGSTGGGGAHNNLQPYVVAYMWKRTA